MANYRSFVSWGWIVAQPKSSYSHLTHCRGRPWKMWLRIFGAGLLWQRRLPKPKSGSLWSPSRTVPGRWTGLPRSSTECHHVARKHILPHQESTWPQPTLAVQQLAELGQATAGGRPSFEVPDCLGKLVWMRVGRGKRACWGLGSDFLWAHHLPWLRRKWRRRRRLPSKVHIHSRRLSAFSL